MGAFEYYGLLDRTALKIQEEQEHRTKYYITLWWGGDGLRENGEGVWSWISRRKSEPSVPVPLVPWPISGTSLVDSYYRYGQYLGGSPDSTIRQLEREQARISYQTALHEIYTNWENQLTQCCARRNL